MSEFDFGVFIGRFQPLHSGHEHVIRQTLAQVDRLIVLIGSASTARDCRNPFTFDERRAMFACAFADEMADGRLMVEAIDDHLYADTAWCADVQRTVKAAVLREGNKGGPALHGLADFRVCLAGYGKDRTSYYLKLFPEWGNVQVDSQFGTFSSTDVRKQFFQRIPSIPASVLSAGVADWLAAFQMTDTFRELLAEAEYLEAYPKQWGPGPFVTADAVVVQSGHILLIRRGGLPGRGQLALPGGFVNRDERIRDAAIRELREETRIADHKGEIPPAMLASFIDDTKTRVFDDPNRSLRGRIITSAFLFRLPERRALFEVKGGDDAAHAQWYRLGELDPRDFFEDHWSIITQMADL